MKLNVNAKMIKEGAVIFAAVFAGVKGFKAGCRGFEKLVPEVVDKITIAKATAAALSPDDEYDEDEDDEE